MKTKKKTTPRGFVLHGNRWRVHVSFPIADAQEVADDAAARDLTAPDVIRERVRKGRKS